MLLKDKVIGSEVNVLGQTVTCGVRKGGGKPEKVDKMKAERIVGRGSRGGR
jgi:hypothetical protein